MPHRITATYQIVTPMFLRGANLDEPEIRPPSVIGALRFWWRALNWHRIQAAIADHANALNELHLQESRLFGVSATEQRTRSQLGRARFRLSVSYRPSQPSVGDDWPNKSGAFRAKQWAEQSGATYKIKDTIDGAAYLGYGFLPDQTNPQHARFLQEGGVVDVSVAYVTQGEWSLSNEQRAQLKQALTALGLFGGLGGHARKGMGSLALQAIHYEQDGGMQRFEWNSSQDIQNAASLLFSEIGLNKVITADPDFDFRESALPPFTAFSPETRFVIRPDSYTGKAMISEAREAVYQLGLKYEFFRKEKIKCAIGRAAFGLPLQRVSKARRASPLFFHIHPIGQHFTWSILSLPAVFYRDDSVDGDYATIQKFLKDMNAPLPDEVRK